MKQVDLYVYLDNVQYRKNYFQNRNRISTGWLTVPVITKGHISTEIKDVRIANDQHWQNKYIGRLDDCFRKSANYSNYREELWHCIMTDHLYIAELNYALIELLRHYLKIDTPTIKASDLDVQGTNTELLAGICEEVNADTYLSGPSGRNYLDMKLFDGITVEFHEYPQDKMLSSLEYIING